MIYISLCSFLSAGKQPLRQCEINIEVFVISETKIYNYYTR